MAFTVHMHYTGMKESTVRVALGGIAYFHKINVLTDHSKSFLILRILKGIIKTERNRPKLLPINLVMRHKFLDKFNEFCNLQNSSDKIYFTFKLLWLYANWGIGTFLAQSAHSSHRNLVNNL